MVSITWPRAFFVYLFVKISKHNEKKVGLHFGNCGFLETTAAVMGRKLTESNSYHVASHNSQLANNQWPHWPMTNDHQMIIKLLPYCRLFSFSWSFMALRSLMKGGLHHSESDMSCCGPSRACSAEVGYSSWIYSTIWSPRNRLVWKKWFPE